MGDDVRWTMAGYDTMALVWTLALWLGTYVQGVWSCGAFDATSLLAVPEKVNGFKSPNYPRPYPYDLEQCWKIEATPGHRVILETTHFMVEVEQSRPCSEADYVDVRDGYYETSPLLRRLCGVQHINITSTGSHMFIRFKSDQSIAWQGFFMRYWAAPAESATVIPDTSRDGCKETSRLIAFNGIMSELVSPNYPHSYYPSLDKCWQLESIDDEKVIFLEVIESALEQAYSCQSGDYVEARDGTDPSDRLLERWCGDSYPDTVISSGPYLLLRFHTDLTDSTFKGFRIRYSIIDKPINPVTPEQFDTSTWILIGAGVLLVVLCVFMAAIGMHKRSLQQAQQERRRSRSQSTATGQEEVDRDVDRVRAAFAAILRRPSHHRDVRVSPSVPGNLQAPPPYQPPTINRPPSHLGFVAPAQPGYHPWMVRRQGRRHRRHSTPGGGHDTNTSQTQLPPEPPPYEEIIKDLEQREWILGPVLDDETIVTVSEAVQFNTTMGIPPNMPMPQPPAEVYDFPPSDQVAVANSQTIPPGCISGDSPQFVHHQQSQVVNGGTDAPARRRSTGQDSARSLDKTVQTEN